MTSTSSSAESSWMVDNRSGSVMSVLPDASASASSWHVPEPPRESVPFPETWHFVVAGASPDGEYAQPESDSDGNSYVDMLFPDEYHKLILDGPPGDGCARLRVYTSSSSKKAVVE